MCRARGKVEVPSLSFSKGRGDWGQQAGNLSFGCSTGSVWNQQSAASMGLVHGFERKRTNERAWHVPADRGTAGAYGRVELIFEN